MCRGDPHCLQFDAKKEDLSEQVFITGSCVYTLARDDCMENGGQPKFEVLGNFRRKHMNIARSYVHEVWMMYFEPPYEVTS